MNVCPVSFIFNTDLLYGPTKEARNALIKAKRYHCDICFSYAKLVDKRTKEHQKVKCEQCNKMMSPLR